MKRQVVAWLAAAIVAIAAPAAHAQTCGCEAPSASCGGGCAGVANGCGGCAVGSHGTIGDCWRDGFGYGDMSLWSAQANAVFLERSTPASRPMLSQAGGAELVNAGDLNFDFETGIDLRVSRQFFLDSEIEFRYLGIDGYNAGHFATATADGQGMIHDANNTPFIWASGNTLATEMKSFLYSTEINFRHPMGCDWVVLAGFRWAELNEDLISNFDFTGGTPASGRFGTSTNNHMYGFQLGAEGPIWRPTGRLAIEGFGKAGIFNNRADQTTVYEQPVGTGFFEGVGSADHTAFMAELGLTAVYHISDCWSLRGGYQVMWLDGVAVATNQLGAVDMTAATGGIDCGGTVFYHGAMAGLEARW